MYVIAPLILKVHTTNTICILPLQLDQLMIKQKVELLPVAIGVKTTINIYKVLTSKGSGLCDAIENTDCCTEICCGHARPFELQIANLHGNLSSIQ